MSITPNPICTLVGGFGSCHSLGVVVGLCGYGMCQMRGAVEAQSS